MTSRAASADTEKSAPVVSRWPRVSRAPLYCAMSTAPPVVTPVQTDWMIKLSMAALLTAASPALPTNRPTTAMSTML